MVADGQRAAGMQAEASEPIDSPRRFVTKDFEVLAQHNETILVGAVDPAE